ncbi:MAG: hypothetical protein ACRC2T_12200 [Thermoguttaceae bacterium]
MEFSRDALQLLLDTAIRSKSSDVFNIGHRKQLRIDRETGEKYEIESEPAAIKYQLLTLEDVVQVFKSHPNSAIYAGEDYVQLIYDKDDPYHSARMPFKQSITAKLLLDADGADGGTVTSAANFEKIAKLRLGVSSAFLDTIRNLQWQSKAEANEKISQVNKNMSAEMIARVLDKDNKPFQDGRNADLRFPIHNANRNC